MIRRIKIEHLILGVLLIYIPFHLFEEALGNFPAWMVSHQWMPVKLTYGHWMAGNIFFYFPLLIFGALIFFISKDKRLFAGVGVILWGGLNFLEHTVYSLIDFKVSPGLLTGFIFGLIACLGFMKLKQSGKLTPNVMVPAFLAAIVYALLPVALQIVLSPYLRPIFI